MKFKKIIDISLMVEEGMITYPGNPETRIQTIRGESSTHSSLSMGTHNGTHVDAPLHVFLKGKGLSAIPLEKLIGVCRVLDLSKVKEVITVEDLKKHGIKKGERILVKTSNSKRGFEKFYHDYVYLDGDAAQYLVKKGVILFGIDALSVKQRGNLDHRAHTVLLEREIVILEGLDFGNVSGGSYTLLALPLKLGNVDGGPARVVLIKN